MMLRRVGVMGRVLLIACIFTASVFVVALKLMNPTEIHIFLEGEETVLSHVMRSYSIYDVAVLIASTFLAGISVTYLLLHDAGMAVGDLNLNNKRAMYEKILPTLKDDEQKVFKAVLDSEGIIAQSELDDLTGVSKSNVSRALDLLESRGYVERRRRGMGNIIVLK
jgi:DNA-binding transcriptional ArsR family regulator